MTRLAAPADGALNPTAAALLDVSVPWWLAVLLFGLAFAIGHATGIGHGYIRGVERERARNAQPQPIAERPRRQMTDSEFDDWSQRFSVALRGATQDELEYPIKSADFNRLPIATRRVEILALADRYAKRVVCGRPAETNLGAVRCLAEPGHPGRC